MKSQEETIKGFMKEANEIRYREHADYLFDQFKTNSTGQNSISRDQKISVAHSFVKLIKECKDDSQLLDVAITIIDKIESYIKQIQLK